MGFGKVVFIQSDFSPLSRNFLLDFLQLEMGRGTLKVGWLIPREGFIWV
jgi:hypothetical protein